MTNTSTTLQVEKITKEDLATFGAKGETYDSIITNLLKEVRDCRNKSKKKRGRSAN